MKFINPIVESILLSRGVETESEINEFLSARPKLTHDPYLLHNLKEGVDLILQTINNQEKICIYGDYDVDGVTATTLLLEFLGTLTDNLTYHIPSRFDEGYGLNKEALTSIKAEGTALVITVDCGSVSFDEVEYAKEIGLKILVTDHHSLNDNPAKCLMINPKQEECKYPFKDLSGCGVAFKLAQGIQRTLDMPKSTLNDLLDLVAIATVGDIVPLLNENRTLVKYGLALCNKGIRPGLSALISQTGLKLGEINAESLAFVIVPHLNAAGRMKKAEVCVELLKSDERDNINKCIDILIENNSERKNLQEQTYKNCLEIVEKKHKDDLCLVIDAGDAHEGITGIVAGKIKDAVHKPTIILTSSEIGKNNGERQLKGTGRCIESINLYNLLKTQEDLFDKFGGHSGACGLSMKEKNLETLRKGLNDELKLMLEKNPDIFVNEYRTDGELQLEDIDINLVDILQQLAPFGKDNEKPKFMFKNVNFRNKTYLGTEKQHAKFDIYGNEGYYFNCILFSKAMEYYEILGDDNIIDLIGTLEINEYKGFKNIQIKVEALRKADSQW